MSLHLGVGTGTGVRADRRSEAPKAERERSVPALRVFLIDIVPQLHTGASGARTVPAKAPKAGEWTAPALVFRKGPGKVNNN